MGGRHSFTSESVSEGHPDKLCDAVSDAVVDAYLSEESEDSRVACETLATTNRLCLAGEVRGPSSARRRVEEVARETVRSIGYEQEGFDWRTFEFADYLHEQSADIALGVDDGADKSLGAGDQGLMFGFACDETEALMPAAIHYAHAVLRSIRDDRSSGGLSGILPDAKAQLTLSYEEGRPTGLLKAVISSQHAPGMSAGDVRSALRPYIDRVLPSGWSGSCGEEDVLINPTGRFVVGGPDGDAGLTGRKIVVDTYGGAAPHGGGAFSGKDPTKVDRSAAYAARHLAKNVVASGMARRCLIQLAYAIGVSRPLSIYVRTEGGEIDDARLASAIEREIDMTPRGIIERLGLRRAIYRRSAAYGHFGRAPEADGGFSWETLDLVDVLRSAYARH